MLNHPQLAARSCDHCKKYVHRDGPHGMGDQVFTADALHRFTLPMVRALNDKPPCYRCPKVPPGALPRPESAVELSDRDWQTYTHYRECLAVNDFPPDPLVRQHAGVIRAVEDAYAVAGTQRMADKMDGLVQVFVAVLRAR